MENIEKNLFYSPSEQLVFWIAGYLGNDRRVEALTEELKRVTEIFTRATGVKAETVHITDLIRKSRRYMSMQVLYAKSENPPDGAFVIKNFNMMEWVMD